jgi:N-acetylglucosamine kinase
MPICFDIGGSAIKAAVVSPEGTLAMIGREPTPLDDFDVFADTLFGLIGQADAAPAEPIAISITGVIDPQTQAIKCANIPCVDGRFLGSDLGARLGRPVRLANDADCFALAEATAGAGRGHHIVFGAILGTGVGGGYVIGGRIVAGAGGYAGEWGHGPVAATLAGDPPISIPRLPCGCGQTGCVDTVGGARGMERLDKLINGTDRTSRAIVTAWQAGDTGAARTVTTQIELLAGPLALVANITGADIIPVGGGLANSHPFIAALDVAVRARMLRSAAPGFVTPGRSGPEPGLIGAAALATHGAFA